MAEWFKAAVLKTARVKVLVGSNPTSTAILLFRESTSLTIEEMKEWYQANSRTLVAFVRAHDSVISSAIIDSDDNKNAYVLLALKRELSDSELALLGFEFEEYFPQVNYATENMEPDAFWESDSIDDSSRDASR